MTRARSQEYTLQGPEGVGEYTLRRSRRAKRVLLRISPSRGLVVTAPWNMDVSQVPGILTRRLDWIESTRRRLGQLREQAGVPGGPYPESVAFPALGLGWQVDYPPGPGPGARVLERGQGLEVSAPDWERAAVALRAFGKAAAKRGLAPWVAALAREFGVPEPRVVVRSQRGRWGSCSSKGNLNLNWKLLFLSPELCRYVLLHELAHTAHMDHSPAYWARLTLWEPRARELDRELRQGWAFVPDWAEE